ncbi:hypothetical protein [Paenibacillus jamilae]|uniref:hypothetical protein n=1 Tax=Paenibacillus TaxID=44249 RepID=UPI001C700A81|nr:hypothetical protein [Paenibacillus jamilae]
MSKAYKTSKKKRTNYIYCTAEGTKINITPGKDGVTETEIDILHYLNDDEVDEHRRYDYRIKAHLDAYHDGESESANTANVSEGTDAADATNNESIVDVEGKKNWENVGSKDKFLQENNYTEDAAQWTGDMNKFKVRDRDGNQVGEIHSGQPEYDYKQSPKILTGKNYPDHFQEYNTKGKLKKLHKFFFE